MRWIFVFGGLAVLGMLAYVRLAPLQVTRFHVPPQAGDVGDTQTAGSFTAVRDLAVSPAEAMAAVRETALATPRTTLLAGSVDEGLMTFISRTRLMGFPDYTTVMVTSGEVPRLVIHARLRFGQADLGVNKARVQDWLAQLGPMISAP